MDNVYGVASWRLDEGLDGVHLEAQREINSNTWIRPIPLGGSCSIGDLIIQHVVDQVTQDAVQSGELELVAESLDRAAIVEAQLKISHAQCPVEPFKAFDSHRQSTV